MKKIIYMVLFLASLVFSLYLWIGVVAFFVTNNYKAAPATCAMLSLMGIIFTVTTLLFYKAYQKNRAKQKEDAAK